MTTSAVLMMILAIAVIWGGLVLAILNLTHFSGEEPGEVQREL